jgi:hypothetical protein
MNIPSKKILRATLVHRSGSGIRFRTSQVRDKEIPSTSRAVVVVLPSGLRLPSKLTVNPANPMITGDSLVKWIKERLALDTTIDVTVAEIVKGKEYQLILPNLVRSATQMENIAKVKTGEENWRFLGRLLDGAEGQSPKRRTAVYTQIERDVRLSPLVRNCFGNQCQVENCAFTLGVNRVLDKFIAEVHHLEHLSQGGTHSAYNLCVLCANHHRLFHRDKTAHITGTSGDDVTIDSEEGTAIIKRDLSRLKVI